GSDAIEHRAFDIGQPPMRTVAGVERAYVLDNAWLAKSGKDVPAGLVVVHSRDGTYRAGRQRTMRRDRIFADLGQVAFLEFFLELDPVLPTLFERQSEHLLKIVAVISFAALAALQPFDHFLR